MEKSKIKIPKKIEGLEKNPTRKPLPYTRKPQALIQFRLTRAPLLFYFYKRIEL